MTVTYVMYGGSSVSKKISFSFATLMAGSDELDSGLSNIKLVHLKRPSTCHKTLKIVKTNNFSFDHPVVFAPQIEAVGAPVNMWYLQCTFGNINIAGTLLLMAFTSAIIVVPVPVAARSKA